MLGKAREADSFALEEWICQVNSAVLDDGDLSILVCWFDQELVLKRTFPVSLRSLVE
jgi:hypothetical protein